MKRISKYAALFAALAGLLITGCDSSNSGGNEPSSPLTVTNGTVISCDRTTKGSVEIPSDVTVIKDYAFSGCTGLTEVSIPSSVRSIGDYAFSGCTGLTEIRIPSGIKSVGQNAFVGCYGLTVRYAGTKKEWNALGGVSTDYITVVCQDGTVGEDDKEQGEKPGTYYTVTFYPNVPQNAGSAGLSSVMREYAAGTSSQIPDDLFVLDGYRLVGWATNANDNTVSCPIGSSFTVLENRDFYAVWEAVIDMPVNGVVIKDNIVVEYRADSGVTEVIIPDGVTAIGDYAFRGCTGVTSVVIPYGVMSIGSSAFEGCTGLVSVEIPAAITSIGSGAFSGCSNLTIHYNGTREQWESLRIETYGVPVVCTDDGQGSENQPAVLTIQNRVVVKCDPSATGYIEIQPGVTEIAASAFNNCISIKGVVIPDGVTSIGNGAFRYCSDMLSVEIPGSVTYIGDRAFEYCNRLEEVNFTGTVSQLAALGLDTKGIKDMGTVSVTVNYGKPGNGPCHYVDSGDTTLTGYVIIPSGVTKIKDGTYESSAFGGCTGLKGVVISGSVTSIGDYAFYDCTGLTYVEVPGSVKEIAYSSFGYYSNPVEINYTGTVAEWASWGATLRYILGRNIILTIDGRLASEITAITADDLVGVTGIYDHAFYDWSNLNSVIIPDSVTSIGYDVFEECGSLTTIWYNGTLAQWCAMNVGSLMSYEKSVMLSDGTNLKGLNVLSIPAGVTTIGSGVFLDCSSLTSVTIPDSVTSIGRSAFFACSGLMSVRIPNSVTIESGAFSECNSLTTIWYDGTETEWKENVYRYDGYRDGLAGKTVTGNDGTTWTASVR